MYVPHLNPARTHIIYMAKPNRLKLDFSLNSREERNEFLTNYLTSDTFKN